jgi:membrane associated rhomboid family serine protease
VTPAAQPEPGFIPTRSHRRAEDWSLVLVSQGIECRILRGEGGWGLQVQPEDFSRAVRTLQVYQRENRHWWRYLQPPPDHAGFHPGVIIWALVLVAVHAWAAAVPELESRGICDTAALRHGELWRLWTAVSLHANLPHLLGNLAFGVLLLGLAMGRFGAGWALVAAFLGAVGANLVSAGLHGLDHRLLGASGMVMAALGLLAAGSLGPPGGHLPARAWLIRGLLAGVLLFLLLGLDPGSDVVAHAAGFVAGIALGVPLRALPPAWTRGSFANGVLSLVALLMLMGAWILALA